MAIVPPEEVASADTAGSVALTSADRVRRRRDNYRVIRHARRPLPPAELGTLLQIAQDSLRVFRSLDGRDRHFLYLCAMGTGFRPSELARSSQVRRT